jgi:hypothetical protein
MLLIEVIGGNYFMTLIFAVLFALFVGWLLGW